MSGTDSLLQIVGEGAKWRLQTNKGGGGRTGLQGHEIGYKGYENQRERCYHKDQDLSCRPEPFLRNNRLNFGRPVLLHLMAMFIFSEGACLEVDYEYSLFPLWDKVE